MPQPPAAHAPHRPRTAGRASACSLTGVALAALLGVALTATLGCTEHAVAGPPEPTLDATATDAPALDPSDTSSPDAGVAADAALVDAAATDAGAATDSANAHDAGDAGPVPLPPSVTILSPADGATLHGPIELSAFAVPHTPGKVIAQVRFLLDGHPIALLPLPPWNTFWDSDQAAEGAHVLRAEATDNGGLTAHTDIELQLDRTAPPVVFTSPVAGLVFDGDLSPLTIGVAATGEPPVQVVVTAFQGALPAAIGTLVPPLGTLSWSTLGLPSGPWVLSATALDAVGNGHSTLRKVTLDRPPDIAWLAPPTQDWLWGPVVLKAQATDDLGLATLALLVDGKLLASKAVQDGVGTITATWQTAISGFGLHTLVARCTDQAGHTRQVELKVKVDQPMTADLLSCGGAGQSGCTPLPAPPTFVSGALPLHVTVVDDNHGPASAELKLDGKAFAVLGAPPLDTVWDTTAVADGVHTLLVRAFNSGGQFVDISRTVWVLNCDQDQDGFAAAKAGCSGADCDDTDDQVFPGAPDMLGDGVDQSCDGFDGVDLDGDGWIAASAGGADCDDSDGSVHPCSDDVPGDGLDQDCDGADTQNCDDCEPCTIDAPSGTACVHLAQNEGGPCDDGDTCTTATLCKSGACVGGTPKSCDDANSCTADACQPKAGCSHSPFAGLCDDGSVCSVTDVCVDGSCVAAPPLPCDDGLGCTDDGCDPKKGCTHAQSPDGAACVGNCNVGVCLKGACQGLSSALWSKADLPHGAARGVVELDNGDFIAVGGQINAGQTDALLARVPASGQGGWNQSLGGVPHGELHAVARQKDGLLVAVGHQTGLWLSPPWSARVVRFDHFGTDKGGFLLEGQGRPSLRDVRPLDNGDLLLAGNDGKIAGPDSAWLLRTGADGTVLWQRKWQGGLCDRLDRIVQLPDGSVLAVGVRSEGLQGCAGFAVRVESKGKLRWTRTISAGVWSGLSAVGRAPQWLLAAGAAGKSASQTSPWMVALTPSGKPAWQRTWPLGGRLNDLAVLPDGGALGVGAQVPNSGPTQALLVRTDGAGNPVWHKALGGPADREALAVVGSRLGGFGLVGVAVEGAPPARAWVTRLGPWGHDSCLIAGLCGSKAAPDCDDADPCTADGCEAKAGCVHAPLANGAACGVGLACLGGKCG